MRLMFYILLAAIVAGLIFLQSFVSGLPFAEAPLPSLTSFQEKQVDLFKDLNNLLITLAIAVIGGVGAFVLDREKAGRLSAGQKARAVASMLLAGTSVYCGYLAHATVLWMLRKSFFNVEISRLVWTERLQFWTFALSIIVLADFFYGALRTSQAAVPGKTTAILSVFTVAALVACAAPAASYAQARHESRNADVQLHMNAEVSTVVTRWQEAAEVVVSGDARGLIIRGFVELQPLLHSLSRKQELIADQEATLTNALIEHYLYDLRDRKLLQAPTKSPTLPRGSQSHLLQTKDVPALTIEAADVLDFSPSSFLSAMRPVLDDHDGYMDILSVPDQATITIDGARKPQLTCRNFVASPGEHTVIIEKGAAVNCTEKVSVSPQKTETISCPKGKKVRCRLPAR